MEAACFGGLTMGEYLEECSGHSSFFPTASAKPKMANHKNLKLLLLGKQVEEDWDLGLIDGFAESLITLPFCFV